MTGVSRQRKKNKLAKLVGETERLVAREGVQKALSAGGGVHSSEISIRGRRVPCRRRTTRFVSVSSSFPLQRS